MKIIYSKLKQFFLIFLLLIISNISIADKDGLIHPKNNSPEERLRASIVDIKLAQDNSVKKSIPLYSWRHDDFFKHYLVMDWATRKNKNYLKEIFDIENYMIGQLIDYYAGFYLGEGKAPKNIQMNNGMGNSSRYGCQIAGHLHPLYFLKYHSPQEKRVVIDIGSGWGTCSRDLALLGYKVYSVDIDKIHLKYQEEHFCDIPSNDSFLKMFWDKNNPELLKKDNFLRHCKIAQNNITYIEGDFADASTVLKLNDKKWDIVIATDSMQFMDDVQRNKVLNTIKSHLQPAGSLVLTMNHNSDGYNQHSQNYFKPITYDFSLEEVYERYFDQYKILTLWIDKAQKLNGYTLKKP